MRTISLNVLIWLVPTINLALIVILHRLNLHAPALFYLQSLSIILVLITFFSNYILTLIQMQRITSGFNVIEWLNWHSRKKKQLNPFTRKPHSILFNPIFSLFTHGTVALIFVLLEYIFLLKNTTKFADENWAYFGEIFKLSKTL